MQSEQIAAQIQQFKQICDGGRQPLIISALRHQLDQRQRLAKISLCRKSISRSFQRGSAIKRSISYA
jgi:hypothetical protein